MRYLFFDIECANCFNGKAKICSFGYVLTETDFSVVRKADLIINPRSKFYLPPDKHVPGGVIEPAYSRAEYRKAPEFPTFYPTIREMLCNPEHIVIGHAPQNDAKFLLQECERYGLEPFDYPFYDNQALYAHLAPPESKLSLESVCEALDIPVMHTHCSMDDAYMTMLTARKLAKKGKAPIEQQYEALPTCCWRVVGGHLMHASQKSSAAVEPKDGSERIQWLRYATKLAKKRPSKRRPLIWMGSNKIGKARSKELTTCLAELDAVRAKRGKLVGRCVAISVAYTNSNLVQTAYLAARIAAAGGTYDQSHADMDVFVYPPETEKFFPCFRYRAAKARERRGKNITFYKFEDFLKLLGVSEEWLATTEYPPELAKKLREKQTSANECRA